MIKFFRRIRRKLINEGNLKRYLFYSVGEILLVMIGILLALQVNNWNEKRKDRNKELIYLIRLYNDIKVDTINHNNFIKLTKYKEIFISSILTENLESFKFIPEENSYDIFISRFQASPNSRDNAYLEMMNSGHFNLIKNATLKENVLNYYRHVENRKEALDSKFSDWPKIISRMIDVESGVIDKGNKFKKEEGEFISEEAQKILIKRLKSEKENLRPHINAELQYTIKQTLSYNELLLLSTNVLNELDKEINLRTK